MSNFIFFFFPLAYRSWYDGDNEAHCFPTWSHLTAQVQIQWRLFFLKLCQRLPESFPYFLSPLRSQLSPLCSPEHSNQRGVNGVSIVDVHVVPAALCGKVIEAQPEHCIRAARQGERRQCSCEKIHLTDRYYFHIFCYILLAPTSECLHCSYGRTLTLQGLEKLFFLLYRCD